MDRRTVFTKTAKGLMEATGKTSVLSRDMRALLKEIDGKATVGEVQNKLGKVPEAKLQEALTVLAKSDFIREFTQAAQTAAPRPEGPAAGDDMDLDFTVAIPTLSTIAKQTEEAAKRKAHVAVAAEAAARAKAEAEARARAAAAAAAARARVEAETKAKAEALEKAKAAAAVEAAARARAEAEARAKAAAEAAARAKAEAESEAKAKARAETAARAKREAEEQARREAEARQRKEAEEKARREADELRAKLEEERKAREEAERRAKEQAERERKEAEKKARREADELRAKLEEERKAREEAERRAKEQAERERKEAEETARREADELRVKLEEERKAREEAERKVKEGAERKAREDAEREAKEYAERKATEHAERVARETEESARREAENRTRAEAERKETERTLRVAREADERGRKEAEDQASREEKARARKEAEDRSRREAEERARREAQEKREAEEKARQDAEEKARREAAEQARSHAPVESGPSLDDLVKIETDFDAVLDAGSGAGQETAKVSAGADDEMQQEAEAQLRREVGAQTRTGAEEKASRAAEAGPRRDEAERRRKDKEEQEGRRVEDRAREEPAVREREHAEEQARLEAQNEETERHFADMEKELEAEEPAAKDDKKKPEWGQEARERDKEDASAVVYRTPIKWGKPVALALFLILILGAVGIHFVSFDGQKAQFEKLAAAHLQQPVRIKALHLSLVPLPHWRIDGVAVGNEGQLEVAQINAVAELGSMFSDKKVFKSLELESPVLSEQGLIALLFGKPQGQGLKVASIIVKNGKLNSKSIDLPALDAKIAMGDDGGWKKIALETPDHKTSLQLEPKGEDAQLEVETNVFSMPFGPAFLLENFSATGVVGRDELRLSEFKGGIYGGYLSGSASLKWGAGWSLGGEISVRAMDPGRIAPALLEEGKLEGKAVYAMRAKTYDELFAAPRLEGTFAVQKGSLLGVDLARLLQGGGVGGKTAFAELTGSFVREGGRTQLRQVHLGAGLVSAGGSADVDASKNISGRFVVELKSLIANARANLAVSGPLREPHFNR